MKVYERRPEATVVIPEIIATGTAKQRAFLFFQDKGEKGYTTADGTPGKGILTTEEEQALLSTFRTAADIKVYTRFLQTDRAIRFRMALLTTALFKYRETIASLTGSVFLHHEYKDFADRLTSLFFSLRSPEDKKAFIHAASVHGEYLLVDIVPTPDPDAHGIEVSTARKDPRSPKLVEDFLKFYSARAAEQLQECKTLLLAIKQIIKETGFRITAHTRTLDNIEKDLKEDKAPLSGYSRVKVEKHIASLAKAPKASLLTPEERERQNERLLENCFYPLYERTEIDKREYELILDVMRIGITGNYENK